MKFFRQNKIFRVFCFLLAIHIFNISADMPDAQPDYIPEDLTVNDMESVVEIVLEEGMGINNAIEEHDEPDDNSQSFQITKEFKIQANNFCEITFCLDYPEKTYPILSEKVMILRFCDDIIPPPPKV